MVNSATTMEKLSILPCLFLPDKKKNNSFQFSEYVAKDNANLKTILNKITEKLRVKDFKNTAEKKKDKSVNTLETIYPKLFEELIIRNKSDYLSIIKEKLFPYIKRILEREVIDFICRRTLAFNKTREKIVLDEFIHGTKSKTNKIITQPILYKRTSVYEGIKLAKEKGIIFTHQFKEGAPLWFFLNTSENQLILENIQAGKITETDLYILNDQKIKELKHQKRENKNFSYSNSEYLLFSNCTTPVHNLNGGYSDHTAQNIENTTIPASPITTINNNYKKNKQHSAAVFPVINFSAKENEYINKLCNLQTPKGININFSKNQAREIVKLNSSRSIFEIIDEKIELLFHEKNSSNSSWASILNNMIREDRGGPEAYLNLCKNRETKDIHQRYLSLIQIFEPDVRIGQVDRERAITILKDRIEGLYLVATKNNNLLVRNELLAKLSKLSQSCNLKEDLGFNIDDPNAFFNQIIKYLKDIS